MVNRMIPWMMSAEAEETPNSVKAALHPRSNSPIKDAVVKIPNGFSLESQATMIAVQPTPPVKLSPRVCYAAEPVSSSAPARPMINADRNTVRTTILLTFIPAYLAVLGLSPTTEIS